MMSRPDGRSRQTWGIGISVVLVWSWGYWLGGQLMGLSMVVMALAWTVLDRIVVIQEQLQEIHRIIERDD